MMEGDKEEACRAILALLRESNEGNREAILTTASGEGAPHATWMASWCAQDGHEVITITSPDSLKIANIKSNDSVEWLFSNADKTVLVYLRGTAQIVTEVAEVKRWWNEIQDKTRAFFLERYNSGIGVSVIKTQVREAEYVRPYECYAMVLDVDEVSRAAN